MFSVLIIDDDKNTRFFIKETLELEKFKVFCASNGQEALDIYEKEYIDLVVVDIMMPNIDGYELTSLFRETNKDLLILMISAKQLPEDRKKGFKLGIDDYMSKPIDAEELVLRIKSLLHRGKIASEKIIDINGVILDYNSFTIKRGNDVIELPQKEFLLLFKLLSSPNKIYTKIQLMDEIWGLDCDTGWETVTVHIGRLKKKLENFNEFSIENIRGLGYKAVIKDDKK